MIYNMFAWLIVFGVLAIIVFVVLRWSVRSLRDGIRLWRDDRRGFAIVHFLMGILIASPFLWLAFWIARVMAVRFLKG